MTPIPRKLVPLRITSQLGALALCCAFAIWGASCAASKAEVQRAKTAGYQADFSTVYGETLAAVVKLYPRTTENAVDGVIRTAWHQVSVEGGGGQSSDPGQQVAGSTANSNALAGSASADRKLFFIRFRVHVVGGKPWRVRVIGEASEWAAGVTPMPLRGAEVPHWLKGRTDALHVSIYERLKDVAVKVEAEIPQAEGKVITIDAPANFGEIPEGAQALLEEIHRALSLRAFPDLRVALADDVQWSEGEVGSADVAMAMWQADTSLLEAMRTVIATGCVAGDGDVSVSCPRAYSETPNYKGHRLILEKRGDQWLITAFVKSRQ